MSSTPMADDGVSRNRLKPNQVGTWGLVFQGIGGVGVMGLFFTIISAAIFVDAAIPLVFIIGLIGGLLSANIVYQYAGRIASARGYYGYAADGLGNHAGAFTGYMYLLYTACNAGYIILFYLYGFSSSFSVLGISFPWWYGAIFMGIVIIVIGVLAILGLRLGVRVMVAIGVSQVLIMLILSSVLTVHSVPSVEPFTPYVGWSPIFVAFVSLGFLSYSGYGSILPLAEEAKDPKKTIRKAILIIFAISGVVYIFMTYSTVVSWGIGNMASFLTATAPPMVILSHRFLGFIGASIIILLLDISAFTLANNFLTAGSRVFYALGRDGLLPKRFAVLHQKRLTPVTSIVAEVSLASLLAIVIGVSLSAYYGVSVGITDAFIILGIITTLAALIVHLMSGASLIASTVKKKFGKLVPMSTTKLIVLPVVALILYLVALYYSVLGISFPFTVAPIFFIIFMIADAVYVALNRRKIKVLPITT